MTFRSTLLLFGILLCMLWFFGVVIELRRGVVDEGYLFPSLQRDTTAKIGSVDMERDGHSYTFSKQDGKWVLKTAGRSSEVVRVQESKIDALIREVRNIRANEQADVPRTFALAGLDEPKSRITLKSAEGGQEWTLYLGNKSADGANIFVYTSDRSRKVRAVSASALENVLTDNIKQFYEKTLLAVTPESSSYLALQAPDKKGADLVVERASEGLWRFQSPDYGVAEFAGEPAKKDDLSIKSLLTDLGGLQVESLDDFVDLKDRTFADYGVQEGDSLRITVKHTPALGGKKTVEDTLLVGRKAKDYYYARLKSAQSVVRLRASKLEPFFSALDNPRALRSRDLTFIDPATADAVDLRTGPELKQVVQLRKLEPTLWKMQVGEQTYKANQLAISGKDGLLPDLQGKGQVKEFFDANSKEEADKLDEKLGLKKPVAEAAIYVNAVEKGKDKQEVQLKKGAAPEVRLLFGGTGKDVVYVKRISGKGTETRMAVPAALLEEVNPPQGYLAYLDDQLPSFDTTTVTRVELNRGAEKFVVERAGDKDKQGWKIVQPADLPDRGVAGDQVAALLQKLKDLQVVRWVKKVPEADELDRTYGLKNPPLSVTLHFKKDKDDKKAEEKVYKFGKDGSVGKEKGIYALTSGTDIIFLAKIETVDFLQKAELRDRSIFQFDPEKVRELQLSGWKDVVKFTLTLKLKRDSASSPWQVSEPAGFQLDRSKADVFVDTLSRLQAERFAAFKGGARPGEHRPATGGPLLAVAFQVEGEKKDRTLTLWQETPAHDGYFAEASTLPGVVFVVPKAAFEPVLKGVSYFSQAQ